MCFRIDSLHDFVICYVQMKASGIDILEKQERTLTEEEAKEFYSHQSEQVSLEKKTTSSCYCV